MAVELQTRHIPPIGGTQEGADALNLADRLIEATNVRFTKDDQAKKRYGSTLVASPS